jgi:hypothetical protein
MITRVMMAGGMATGVMITGGMITGSTHPPSATNGAGHIIPASKALLPNRNRNGV